MLVHLDSSVMVDAFTGERRLLPVVVRATSAGDLLAFSSLAFYEWLRGPRVDVERTTLGRFFHLVPVVVFGEREAATAASLYTALPRARQRQVDLAIAACAIEHGAALWTINTADFDDIPGLRLYRPPREP